MFGFLKNLRQLVQMAWDGQMPPVPPPDYELYYPREGDETFWAYRKKGQGHVPATEAGISIIVELLTACDWQVCRRIEDGARIRYEPIGPNQQLADINRLLRDPCDDFLSGIEWKEYFLRCAVADGNAFARIERGLRDIPRKLYLAKADTIPYKYEGRDLRWSLQDQIPGGWLDPRLVDDADVLRFHASGFTLHTMKATSPLGGAGRDTVESAQDATLANRNALKRGAISGQAIVEQEGAAQTYGDTEKLREVRTTIRDDLSSPKNAGKLPVIPAGYELSGQTISSLDLNVTNYLRWTVQETARLFRIDSGLLGHHDPGVRQATNEQTNARLEKYCIRPWADRLGAALTRRLIPMQWRDRDYVVYVDTSLVGAGTLAECAEIAYKMVGGGIWTVNESREYTGKAAMDDGDQLYPPKGHPVPDEGIGSGNDTGNDSDVDEEMLDEIENRMVTIPHLNGHGVLSP